MDVFVKNRIVKKNIVNAFIMEANVQSFANASNVKMEDLIAFNKMIKKINN